jgi:mono/diheme cytochrome c family protein
MQAKRRLCPISRIIISTTPSRIVSRHTGGYSSSQMNYAMRIVASANSRQIRLPLGGWLSASLPRERRKPMCKLRTERNQYGRRHLGGVLALALLGTMAAGAEEPKSASAARELFVKSCAVCHSADGTAQTSVAKKLGVKDLSQSKLSDAQIIQQVSEGRQENQSATKMPAFKERLSRGEIESLVPVVKDFRKENSQANLRP